MAIKFSIDDPSPLTYKATGPQWFRSITIESASTNARGRLIVQPTTLTADDIGAPLQLKFSHGESKNCDGLLIENPRWPVSVVTSASSIQPATYGGLLRVQFSNAPDLAKAIKLTREPKDYKVSSALAVSDEGLFQNPLVNPRIQIGIEAPKQHDIDISARIFQFKKLRGSEPAVAEEVANLILVDGADTLKPAQAFHVPAGQSKRLTIEIPGVLDPGRYQAELKLESADHPSKDYTVDVTVRRWWFWALLSITLGVLLSMAIKHWVKDTRPRLTVRHGIALLRQHLAHLRASGLTPAEETVIAAVEGRIDKLLQEVEDARSNASDWQTASMEILKVQRDKLNALGHMVTARRLLEDLQLDQTTLNRASETLRLFADHLRSEDALDAAKARTIDDLIAELQGKRAQLLEQAFDDLQAEAFAQEQEAASSAQELAARDALVALEDARKDLVAQDFGPMALSYGRARLAVARASAHHVIAKAQGDAAAVARSEARFAGPVLDTVTAVANRALREPDADSAMLLARRAEDLAAFGSAALGDSRAARTPVRSSAHPLPVRSFSPAFPEAPSMPPPSPPDNAVDLWKRIRRGDYLVDGLTILVASVIGMYSVWVPNAIWGTPLDFIAAFFWGLGLGELGKVTFSGINNLRTSLGA